MTHIYDTFVPGNDSEEIVDGKELNCYAWFHLY